MISDRGCWLFDGIYYGSYNESYPEIMKSLRILMENLISSKILLPKALYGNISLQYDTVDELLDQIEASGYLENAFEFAIWGDTIIYTPNGEEVHQDIIRIERFRTSGQDFGYVVRTDHWLPMMMDRETMDFTWNLEQYQLNYYRIPALLSKLNEELGWKNEELLFKEEWYLTVQAGYDFYLEESVIIREYEANPNPAFDLEAYLAAIKNAREKYTRKR
ncbi:hypothetical protein SAMN05518672_102370 [Chitinophaga sp. CF118]|uniref:hypothetical protein n=1 Tax=Chitinophaga sp. CF118 TaxID=1884367 RepID=UPI0008E690FC|nr:hypothetical protein [Chitinophaga sp. CF118]SFD54470.1 hypothetical protein SAMN05518672_102370 [Chitinophaga sp. CF118]